MTIDELERWLLCGAYRQVLDISNAWAEVEFCTCTGEPLERCWTQDPAVIGYPRTADTDLDPAGPTPVSLDVRTKRVYDPAAPRDGCRVLIDRVWPRGVSRERARLDEWARELAPSDGCASGSTMTPSALESSEGGIATSYAITRSGSRSCATAPIKAR